MLGMPLMGGPTAALDGRLVSIVAVNKEAFERTKQVIETVQVQYFI